MADLPQRKRSTCTAPSTTMCRLRYFVLNADLLTCASSLAHQINANTIITPPAAGTVEHRPVLASSFTKQLTINQNGSSQTYVAIHLTVTLPAQPM